MKILFVDDEKIIREGMAELIDWEKLGCDKPAMAESADKALRLLREEPFDLVITDIYMSKMSGIELAKQIRESWPSVKVMLLSAYEDFGYAREAIEAGVFKYLLKPVVPEEMEQAVLEAMKRVRSDRIVQDQVLETEKIVKVYRPQLARDFWRAVLRGEISDREDFGSRMNLAEIQPGGGPMSCMAIRLDGGQDRNSGQDRLSGEAFRMAVFHAASSAFGGCVECVRLSEGQAAVLLRFQPSGAALMEFSRFLEEELHQKVRIAVGRMVDDWMELPSSLRDAGMVLETGAEGGQEAGRLIARSVQMIDENIGQEEFGVNDISEALHVSPGYFSRLFKRQMGLTCIEYITGKRIERAKQLLEHTNIKHQAIAQAVGYSNVYYFSMQFKKHTGETPGQYRKRVGKRDV